MDDSSDSADLGTWLSMSLLAGLARLEEIIRALERDDMDLGVDPSAWDNAMAALEWAVTLGLTSDRVVGIPLTAEDRQRIQRVHTLGSEALSGRGRAPELLPLAQQCLRALEGGGYEPPP